MSTIRDAALAPSGQAKIDWVKDYMPLLGAIRETFEKEQPFKGMRIAVSVHMEAKTAYLCQVLAAGGAQVAATGCNPLSTQDDVAAALAQSGVEVFAWHGASEQEYWGHLNAALDIQPQVIVDDGGDFVHLLHGERKALQAGIWGGCEETTTGVMRLKARVREGLLAFPMISVNDAQCKHFFDNRYGTGQSVWDGIMRTTNLIVAGKTVVVAGYGWCGKGVSFKAKGLGARVVICEVDPVKAIEAVMDGYEVMPMAEAARIGDVFITVTGCRDVIRREHMEVMKSGVLLANAGHFDVEINKGDLRALCGEGFVRKPGIEGFRTPNGRVLNLLAEGRLVNLAAGDGHPAEIMDMSFALQALCARYVAQHHDALKERRVYEVPQEIDRYVAQLKLQALGCGIDALSPEQQEYISGWEA